MSDAPQTVEGAAVITGTGRMPFKYVPVKSASVERAAKIIAAHAARTCAEATGNKGGKRYAQLLTDQASSLRQAAVRLDAEALRTLNAVEDAKRIAAPKADEP